MLPTLTGPLAITARRVAILFAVLLVAGGGAIFAIRTYADVRLERARAQFEAEVGSLDPASYAPEPIEQDLNAAFWLRSGIEAIPFAKEELPDFVQRRMESLGSPWSADDETAFVSLRTEIEPARVLMDRALALERSSQGLDYTRFDLEMPDGLVLLRVARLIALDCDLAIQRGDLEAAIGSVMLLERIAAVERHEPLLRTILIGGAVERIYHDRIESLLRAISETAHLDRVGESLGHLERSTAPFHRALAHQAALGDAMMEEEPEAAAANADLGPTSVYDTVKKKARQLLRMDWYFAAGYLEWNAAFAGRSKEPFAGFDLRQWWEAQSEGADWDPIGEFLLPNLIHSIEQDQATVAARRLAGKALDLRRARIVTGTYPASLTDPPVSAYTGETASYRRLDDGGVEIAFPESLRAWEATWTHGPPTGARAPRLVWRLPA